MRFGRVVAVLALLGLAAGARAEEVVAVRERPSAAGVVARDALAGVLVGSAIATGVILYQTKIDNESDYEWGRTLAWGAVIGLGAGLVLGFIETASASSRMVSGLPVRDGHSTSLDVRSRDQSHRQLFPIVAHGF